MFNLMENEIELKIIILNERNMTFLNSQFDAGNIHHYINLIFAVQIFKHCREGSLQLSSHQNVQIP